MDSGKYKIAFTGVFDLANYGDHLFPVVFKAMMERKGLEVELYLFSLVECKEALNDTETNVYALGDMEKMHRHLHFDAIVVGGGGIIHYSNVLQKYEIGAQDYKNYSFSEMWVIPSLLAYKYNIHLIWNTPEVPFKFSEKYCHLTKALCGSVDYLSVRNEFSKEVLIECGISADKISVYPDTVLQISEIIDSVTLDHIRNKIIDFNDKYVVFHTNRFIKKEDIPLVIKGLNSLIDRGYKIILLPLAYTHGDEEILHEINLLSDNRYIEFDNTLSYYEMMSVLAGCTLYIGTSFHGAITAFAYGKKAIAFNFLVNKKTEDLFHFLHVEKYHITNADNIQLAIDLAINNDIIIDTKMPKNDLEKHFDNIYNIIVQDQTDDKFLNDLPKEIIACIKSSVSDDYVKQLEKDMQWHIKNMKDTQNYIKQLEDGLKWSTNNQKEMQNYYNREIERLQQKLNDTPFHRFVGLFRKHWRKVK